MGNLAIIERKTRSKSAITGWVMEINYWTYNILKGTLRSWYDYDWNWSWKCIEARASGSWLRMNWYRQLPWYGHGTPGQRREEKLVVLTPSPCSSFSPSLFKLLNGENKFENKLSFFQWKYFEVLDFSSILLLQFIVPRSASLSMGLKKEVKASQLENRRPSNSSVASMLSGSSVSTILGSEPMESMLQVIYNCSQVFWSYC